MKTKFFVVNGYGTSGKDTFCDYCKLHLSRFNWRGYTISTVDYVKDVASYCGWNGNKDSKSRKFLSDLKDALTEWGNIPYLKVNEEIHRILEVIKNKQLDGAIFFIIAREPEDIQQYVDKLGAQSVFIDRDIDINFTNHADNNVKDFNYDWIIDNNGNLDELATNADMFCDYILKEKEREDF